MSNPNSMFEAMDYTPPEKPETQVNRCIKCEHGTFLSDVGYCVEQDLCLEIKEDEIIMASRGVPIECHGEEWRYIDA